MIPFPEELKIKLENSLFAIADFNLQDYVHPNDSVNLFWGNSGVALFYHFLHKSTNEKKYLEKAIKAIESAIESSSQLHDKETAFCSGISGFAWVMNYLSKFDEYEIDCEEYLVELDSILLERVKKSKLEPVYDPMYGTLGYASYFLTRNTETADLALAGIVDFLDTFKLIDETGITWESEKSFVTKPTLEKAIRFNLGLAHGIPAILLLLGRIYERGICIERCKYLIEEGYKWLLAQHKRYTTEYQQFGDQFPHHIKTTGEMRQAKISWCYGDLSIAVALAQTAKRIGNNDMLAFSKYVGLKTAEQVPKRVLETSDIGICHGSAGNGYMFYKLDKIFNEDIFKGASILYYNFLMRQRSEGYGVAGFRSWHYNSTTEKQEQRDDASMLTGGAGIGLCLLSALYNTDDTYWDNCFLLS